MKKFILVAETGGVVFRSDDPEELKARAEKYNRDRVSRQMPLMAYTLYRAEIRCVPPLPKPIELEWESVT